MPAKPRLRPFAALFVIFAGLGFGAIASADLPGFTKGEPLDSSKMNAKFRN
jgi:hypothetical protein